MEPISNEVCKFWERGGCPKGAICPLRHPPMRDGPGYRGDWQGRRERSFPSERDDPFRRDRLREPRFTGRPERERSVSARLRGYSRGRSQDFSPETIPDRFSLRRPSPRFEQGKKKTYDPESLRVFEARKKHREEEEKALEPPQPINETPELCKFWKRGKCIKGKECSFFHPPDSEEEPEVVKKKEELPKKPCKFYKKGTCRNGADCAFEHIDYDENNNPIVVNKETLKRKNETEDEQRPTKRIKTKHDVAVKKIGVLKKKPRKLKTRVDIGARDPEKEKKLDKALERIDLKLCLQVAIKACKACGEQIIAKKDDQKTEEELTEMEEECAHILAAAIAGKYPFHTIVSKQNISGHISVSPAPTWFISPIDGLENYRRGSPLVCVSIGLCVQRRPVLGVIYNPILGQLFASHRGGGTFFDGINKSASVANSTELKEAIIMSENWIKEDLVGKSGVDAKSFRSTGSFNQNFLEVLRGASDGGIQYREQFEGPWSVCAGVTMIEEAGGVVTDPTGNLFELSLDKREIVFGPKKLVEEMLRYF